MINLEACSTLYPSYRYYKRVKLEFTNALKRAQGQYKQEELIRLKETAELAFDFIALSNDLDIIRHAWYEQYK